MGKGVGHGVAGTGELDPVRRARNLQIVVDGRKEIAMVGHRNSGAATPLREQTMANFAYFADMADGTVLEFKDSRIRIGEDRMGCARYRDVPARISLCIPTTEPFCNGNVLCGYKEGLGWVRITRKVVMKSNPSRHDCDARCYNASGRTMNCECSCGGKNHGKGAFKCVEA